ncbi:MAG TPA: DUF29 domain-containing protein [Bosea sp. (in: a-proteobacteria)]|jgi:hypothetical protein|uniref:DUF29 domain-containing protein n=1 Tax=Bosea sp. (in: a-proteobacteria) TaxID=1871050 RepID=UPI002DDCE65E|nr:DUF29 domain-containing protein [Bosea sp. (in: a-proteobacteria)]HEV2555843.1 DUF29 domain-containing protein [Bosea sp. (in: a-proteobacteria)]
MPADTLYEDDIVSWSERQAQGIRELARTRPELSNLLDWENIAEEIETLGRSEWKAVASKLRVALEHILKAYCDPDALSCRVWEGETNRALAEAREDYRPSMRQHLDIDAIWQGAFRFAADTLRIYGVRIPPGIPTKSPFELDQLLDAAFDHRSGLETLLGKSSSSH